MLSCEMNRDESLKVFSLDLPANYALPLTLPAIQASNLSLKRAVSWNSAKLGELQNAR